MNPVGNNVDTFTMLINTAVTTAGIPLYGAEYAAVLVPSAWTAADITFKGCDTIDGTYAPVLDEGGNLVRIRSVPTGTSSWMMIPAEVMFSAPYIKLNSTNTASTADVNQAAARTLKIAWR